MRTTTVSKLGAHTEPDVGQTWSLLGSGRSRYEFTIERIEDDGKGVLRAYGRSAKGRPVMADVRTLRRGLRGARLVRFADGTSPTEAPKLTREQLLAEPPSKPRTERVYRPKGAPPQDEVTPEMTRVLQMRARGMSRPAIARELGDDCTEDRVRRLEEAARDIQLLRKVRAA